MIEPADSLCQKLGYVFEQAKFLEQALAHRSLGSNNNERLEFLGDSILGFVIAEALYQTFPEATEGDLSRLRAGLVKRETLAQIAREIDLGSHIKLGPGELKSGGFNRDSILADALEAIFAAIYLDGGTQASREVILKLSEKRLTAISPKRNNKDPKTRLQELLQARRQALPEYRITDVRGREHAQLFTAECRIDELDICVSAEAGSRRKAEQGAAAKALGIIGE